MAWENLDSISYNGVTYKLPKLPQSKIDWVVAQSVIGAYKEYSSNDIIENNASSPFKYTQRPDGDLLVITFDNEEYIQFYGWRDSYELDLNFMVRSGSSFGRTLGVYNRGYYSSNLLYYFGILIDHENEIALAWCFNSANENQYFLVAPNYGDYRSLQALYTDIVGVVPPSYNWQSVSSITGRMGNLPLAQVKSQYINGGNPVSAATLSYFTNLPVDSNVGNLVIDTSIDSAEVLVKYRIPEGTYGYINLVYKENSEPANLYDGVVNVIRQNESQIVLDSITTSGTYYFKIFTDKGNSNTVVLNYIGIIPIIFSIEREW